MIAFLALTIGAPVETLGLGDRLVQSFGVWIDRPLTTSEAVAAGWAKASDECVKGLGYAYTYGTLSPSQPVTLYYSASGQIAGIGTEIYGPVQSALVAEGFVTKSSVNTHHISVGLRQGDMCEKSTVFAEPVGDALIISPSTIAHSIPLTTDAATAANYHKGACFDAMGVHWMYDTQTAPKMSWNASTLVPVVPMYWPTTGKLATFLFASTSNETGVEGAVGWDGIGALPNSMMCINTCDKECTFAGTDVWSTMHFFFHDPKSLTCDRKKYTCLPVPPAPIPGVGCCETPTAESLITSGVY